MRDENGGQGSSDLLREAKEALRARPADPTPKVARGDIEDPAAVSVGTPVPPSRPVARAAVTSPADAIPTGGQRTGRSGTAARIIGILLFVGVGVFWFFLVAGIVIDPTDIGWAIFGGVMASALPVLLGLYLVRRANRAKRASGQSDISKLGYEA